MTDLSKPLKSMNLIWMAMCGSIVVYIAIAVFWMNQVEPSADRNTTANLIWLFALGFGAMGLVFPKMLFKNAPAQARLTAGYITQYALFEMIAICALFNFLRMGVSFAEAAAGFTVALLLIATSKPKL